MEAGPGGVHRPAVISLVVVDAPYVLAPAQALHPRMVGRSVRERKTKSCLVTPNHAVRLTRHVHLICSDTRLAVHIWVLTNSTCHYFFFFNCLCSGDHSLSSTFLVWCVKCLQLHLKIYTSMCVFYQRRKVALRVKNLCCVQASVLSAAQISSRA